MAGVKFPGQTNFLTHKISTSFQRVFLRAARQHKWMVQARDIQLETVLALG